VHVGGRTARHDLPVHAAPHAAPWHRLRSGGGRQGGGLSLHGQFAVRDCGTVVGIFMVAFANYLDLFHCNVVGSHLATLSVRLILSWMTVWPSKPSFLPTLTR
jgi:hypothetical protein